MATVFSMTLTRACSRAALAGSAAMLALAAADAQAQPATAAGASVGELVVTAPHYVPKSEQAATKTNIPIIETPQSISVIPRDQIDVLNWQSTQQAVRYTSGVNGENFGPDQRYDYVTVRGFYPVEYIDGLQAPIAPGSSLNDIGIDLWGFDTVQIIKGPASFLYGESPPGGIVDLTSRGPQDAFHGEGLLQVGSFSEWEGAADVTGQIVPGLDGRLTALVRDADTQLDFEHHRRVYVAPAFTWKIDSSDRLTFLSFFQNDRDRGCCGGFLPEQGTLLPNPNGVIPTSRNLGEPGYNVFTRDEYGIGYEFNHDFGRGWTVEQDLKEFWYKDNTKEVYGAGLEPDLMTEDRYNFVFPEQIRELAIDTRLNGHFDLGEVANNLLVGLDYRHYTNVTQFGFAVAPSINIFHPAYGAAIAQLPLFPDIHDLQVQTGIYAQEEAKWRGFVLTVGGREDFLHDHPAGAYTSNNKFTYRVGLNYLFANGLAPYITYATSFFAQPGSDFSGRPFVPTTGHQVEGGVKFQPTFLPPGANVLVTAAAYDLVQNNVLTPDPNHTFFSIQTGQVEVKGFELEGVARLFERISLNGSYTYTDSRVTAGTAYVGNQLFETPHNKLSLFADYTQQTGPLAGLGIGFGGRYLSSSFGDQANQFVNPAVTLFDGIIHYDRSGWRLAINADNLFDKIYVARCSSASQCFYGERRVIMGTISRKW
ncbi:MAG TPA: TonB-dependent siderophore receptor [Caulobacteraceae bacterium]|nr:TonB-dependent siderophore receptor [Caulobacteraceae bacterium]